MLVHIANKQLMRSGFKTCNNYAIYYNSEQNNNLCKLQYIFKQRNVSLLGIQTDWAVIDRVKKKNNERSV